MKTGSLERNKEFKFRLLLQNTYFILFFILSIFLTNCNVNGPLEQISFAGSTMGTTYSVKVIAPQHQSYLNNIQPSIDSVLNDVNLQMSTYIKDSEISQFNSSFDTTWFNVSDDFAYIINEAKNISVESHNSYDITVGPIVNLWGFGPEAVPLVVPSQNAIKKAKDRTGIEKIKVDLKENKIKKTIPDLYIDLSSIAKGFGVDKVGLYLEELEIKNYMVEIGGEVRTRGKNQKHETWKIGISTPLSDGLQKIVKISGQSVATSGDYLNYFEKEGVRYSHLINPKSGRPITHNLASVTVIDEDCRIADAYATAINVLGPVKGFEFANEKKLPIFMIVREGDIFIEKITPEFEEFIYKGN